MKPSKAPVQGLLALLLLLPACLRGEVINLPLVEGARTVIFVNDDDPGQIWIGGPDSRPASLSSGTYTLLYYAWTPESLGVGPSGYHALIASAQTQLAPTPIATYVQTGTEPRQWQSDEGSERHLGIEIPRPDLRVCLNEVLGCVPEDAPLRCEPQCNEIPRPAAPELPRMTCPEGWIAEFREGTQIQVCRNPLPSAQNCPQGEYQPTPGQACAPLGACGAGAWPSPPVGQDVIVRYIDAEAGPAGDGSQGRPWRSLSVAAQQAPIDATLLLSRGSHRGGVSLTRTTTLIGVCAEHTQIEAGTPAVSMDGGDLTLIGIQISSDDTAVKITDGNLVMQDVLLRGAGPLLEAQDCDVQATGLVTRDSLTAALNINGGAQVQLQNWDHRGGPGLALTGPDLQLKDATLRSDDPMAGGAAINLSSSSTTTVFRTQIQGYGRGTGVATRGVFSRLEFTDVVMQGCDRGLQVGIEVDEGEGEPMPLVTMTRVSLTDIATQGVLLPGVAFEAHDLVSHAGRREAIMLMQATVWRATATIHRLWAESRSLAVVNVGPDKGMGPANITLSGEDWVVYSVPDDKSIFTIRMVEGVRIDLRRIWAHGGRDTAIRGRCASGSIEDLTVVTPGFRGFWVQASQDVRLSRARITGGSITGLEVGQSTGSCGQAALNVDNLTLTGCGNCERGVLVPSGTVLLDRSHISNYRIAGETIADGQLFFRRGRVTNYSTGFKVTSETIARQVVRGIEFDGPGALRIAK